MRAGRFLAAASRESRRRPRSRGETGRGSGRRAHRSRALQLLVDAAHLVGDELARVQRRLALDVEYRRGPRALLRARGTAWVRGSSPIRCRGGPIRRTNPHQTEVRARTRAESTLRGPPTSPRARRGERCRDLSSPRCWTRALPAPPRQPQARDRVPRDRGDDRVLREEEGGRAEGEQPP